MKGRPSTWKTHSVTKIIRVPDAYADRLLELAHWWDTGGHAHAPEPLTAEAADRMRDHLRRYTPEALIAEILAFRTDQDALWARIAREEPLK